MLADRYCILSAGLRWRDVLGCRGPCWTCFVTCLEWAPGHVRTFSTRAPYTSLLEGVLEKKRANGMCEARNTVGWKKGAKWGEGGRCFPFSTGSRTDLFFHFFWTRTMKTEFNSLQCVATAESQPSVFSYFIWYYLPLFVICQIWQKTTQKINLTILPLTRTYLGRLSYLNLNLNCYCAENPYWDICEQGNGQGY